MEVIPKFIVFVLYLCLVNESESSRDVSFLSYTDENFKTLTNLDPKQLSCHQCCRVDKLTDVFFIIHGWLQSVNESYVTDIIKLLYVSKKKKTSIIVVDWSKFARKEYDVARSYNEFVANATADEISRLMKVQKLSPAYIQIICHCMGCHIAGLTGKNIQAGTGEKIGRITALDPAGPAYSDIHHSKRLSPDDATIVFVVHTDAFVFGYGERCGTIDFYPNGGKDPQPGCLKERGVIEYDMCSHQRSIIYYIESLNCYRFFGIQCESYESYIQGLCSSNRKVDFRGPLKKEHSGTYFIKTNLEKPFLRK